MARTDASPRGLYAGRLRRLGRPDFVDWRVGNEAGKEIARLVDQYR
jgi:hypothetical protein